MAHIFSNQASIKIFFFTTKIIVVSIKKPVPQISAQTLDKAKILPYNGNRLVNEEKCQRLL